MAARMAKPNADVPPISRIGFRIGVDQDDIVVSNRRKEMRPYRDLATCSHGTLVARYCAKDA
jgi:hypothetical protein